MENTNTNDNDKLSALKAFSSATTLRGMRQILENAGQMLSPDFSKMENDEQTGKVVKFIIFLITILAIFTVACFAYIGGDIAMSHGSSAAIVCGIVDASLAVFLYTQILKGKARWGALVFEIVTLFLLGYLMTGYFGRDNLKTVAETKIMADYEIVNKYRTSVQSIADQAVRAAQNAKEVAQIEFDRDGKGVVYEKGMMIGGMKIDSVPIAPVFTKTPDFISLNDANKYLHAERKKLSDLISKISSTGFAIQQQVGGVNEGLKQAFAMGLSAQQTNNLQVLSGTLTAIEKADISNAKLSESVLTHDDLKADGMQGMFGYGADVIVIFFIVVLALQKENSSNLEKVRDSEGKLFIQDILSEEHVSFDPEKSTNVKFKSMFEAVKVVTSEDGLKAYIRKYMTFNQFLDFMREHPTLAVQLGSTKWAFRDIQREIEKNPDFLSIAQDAIQMTPTAWEAVNSFIPSPVLVLEMKKETRDSFTDMLISLAQKLQKPERVKEFMGKFVRSYNNVSEDFLKSLEICIEKLPAKQLVNLTPEFVKNISPVVATHLCPMIDHKSDSFSSIVNTWDDELNESYEEIMDDSVSSLPNFNRLWKAGIEYGGVDGLLTMIQAYKDKKKESSSSTAGGKVVSVEPDFEKIQNAISTERTEEFLKLIASAFVSKAKMMRV